MQSEEMNKDKELSERSQSINNVCQNDLRHFDLNWHIFELLFPQFGNHFKLWCIFWDLYFAKYFQGQTSMQTKHYPLLLYPSLSAISNKWVQKVKYIQLIYKWILHLMAWLNCPLYFTTREKPSSFARHNGAAKMTKLTNIMKFTWILLPHIFYWIFHTTTLCYP